MAVIFGIVTLQLGKNTLQRQRQELEMAARHFILDCRFVQQKNMFASSADRLDIVPSWGMGKYNFVKNTYVVTERNFADIGCSGIIFSGNAIGEIVFSGSGSVNDEKSILLRHKDNEAVHLTLNLQPVTGRIEISE